MDRMRSLTQEESRPRVDMGGYEVGYRKSQPCETSSPKSRDYENGEQTETFSLSR